MVFITSASVLAAVGLVASVSAGPIPTKRHDDKMLVYIHSGSTGVGQGCDRWERQCQFFVDGNLGISTCVDGSEMSKVPNTLIVSCDAPNGDVLADKVAQKYGWVNPNFGETDAVQPTKRHDDKVLVYIHEGSVGVGQGCDRWERQCQFFVDGAQGISTCMDGSEISGIANTLIASCDAPNGDMLAAELAQKYGWVHPTFGAM